jgi:hypothetical protein
MYVRATYMTRFQNQFSLSILSGGQDYPISTLAGYGFENKNSIPDGDRNVSSYHSYEMGSGVHPTSYPVGTATSQFLDGKEGRSVKLTDCFYLMSNIRMHGTAYPLPPYASMTSKVDLAG